MISIQFDCIAVFACIRWTGIQALAQTLHVVRFEFMKADAGGKRSCSHGTHAAECGKPALPPDFHNISEFKAGRTVDATYTYDRERESFIVLKRKMSYGEAVNVAKTSKPNHAIVWRAFCAQTEPGKPSMDMMAQIGWLNHARADCLRCEGTDHKFRHCGNSFISDPSPTRRWFVNTAVCVYFS